MALVIQSRKSSAAPAPATKFIVMTACAKMPASVRHRYGRVAVVEIDPAITLRPAMISERARGVVRIIETWEKRHVGKTVRCAYERAYKEACDLANALNAGNSAMNRKILAQKVYNDALAAAQKVYNNALAAAEKVYNDALAAAQKVYNNALAPAQKVYNDALAAAWKAYNDVLAPAWKAYNDALAPAWKAYNDALAPAEKAYDDARAAAQKVYNDAVTDL